MARLLLICQNHAQRVTLLYKTPRAVWRGGSLQ